jgi:hypothetical protein
MTSTERSRRLPGRARSKFCERPAFDAHLPTWEGAFHAEQLRRGDETKSSGAGTPAEDYPRKWAAIRAVSKRLAMRAETLRNWIC